MNKNKSILVTVIISVMLAVIAAGLFILYMPGFVIVAGSLAAYGFFHSAKDFCGWLHQEPPLEAVGLLTAKPDHFYDWEKDESLEPVSIEKTDPVTDQDVAEIDRAVSQILEEQKKNTSAGA